MIITLFLSMIQKLKCNSDSLFTGGLKLNVSTPNSSGCLASFHLMTVRFKLLYFLCLESFYFLVLFVAHFHCQFTLLYLLLISYFFRFFKHFSCAFSRMTLVRKYKNDSRFQKLLVQVHPIQSWTAVHFIQDNRFFFPLRIGFISSWTISKTSGKKERLSKLIHWSKKYPQICLVRGSTPASTLCSQTRSLGLGSNGQVAESCFTISNGYFKNNLTSFFSSNTGIYCDRLSTPLARYKLPIQQVKIITINSPFSFSIVFKTLTEIPWPGNMFFCFV